MQVAQALYEGVDLGGSEGTQGLITYMRTDSTRIADQRARRGREFIDETYGAEFYGGRARTSCAKARRTRTRRSGRRTSATARLGSPASSNATSCACTS